MATILTIAVTICIAVTVSVFSVTIAVALTRVDAIDDEMDVQITGATLRSVNTIEELYNLVMSKK